MRETGTVVAQLAAEDATMMQRICSISVDGGVAYVAMGEGRCMEGSRTMDGRKKTKDIFHYNYNDATAFSPFPYFQN